MYDALFVFKKKTTLTYLGTNVFVVYHCLHSCVDHAFLFLFSTQCFLFTSQPWSCYLAVVSIARRANIKEHQPSWGDDPLRWTLVPVIPLKMSRHRSRTRKVYSWSTALELWRQAVRGWPHVVRLQHPEGVDSALGVALTWRYADLCAYADQQDHHSRC